MACFNAGEFSHFQRLHCSPNNMKIQCSFADCRKQFASAPNLRRHIASFHLGVRHHECTFCLARFSSKQNLTIHLFRHRRPAFAIPSNAQVVGRVQSIPLLTTMVKLTSDPDLRPYSKIIRLYPYPIGPESPTLPKIHSVEDGANF